MGDEGATKAGPLVPAPPAAVEPAPPGQPPARTDPQQQVFPFAAGFTFNFQQQQQQPPQLPITAENFTRIVQVVG